MPRTRKLDAEDEQASTNTPSPAPSTTKSFTLPQNDPKKAPIYCETRSPTSPNSQLPSLIFTHGAGGDLSSPAMSDFTEGFSRHGRITSFKGNMNMKSRLTCFKTVIQHCKEMVVGGRSMGARAAAILAGEQEEDVRVEKVVLVNFPLMSEKGESREEVLLGIRDDVEVLFVAGTMDSMCGIPQLLKVVERMQAKCWVVVVEGADHGMSLKQSMADATHELRLRTGEIAEEWIREKSAKLIFRKLEWDGTDNAIIDTGWQKEYRPTASPKTAGSEREGPAERPAKRSRKSKG